MTLIESLNQSCKAYRFGYNLTAYQNLLAGLNQSSKAYRFGYRDGIQRTSRYVSINPVKLIALD